VGDGEKLLTHLNSALKVLLGLDIFPRVSKKKLNFVDQCYCSGADGIKIFWDVTLYRPVNTEPKFRMSINTGRLKIFFL